MFNQNNLPPGVSVFDEHINPSDPKPKAKPRSIFAAQWEDGTYEIIVSDNGEAERRIELARGLGGPKRIAYARVGRKHTDKTVREYFSEYFLVAEDSLIVEYIGSCRKLKGAKL